MPLELLTVEDLEKFKAELLREIRTLINTRSATENKLLKTKEVCQILRVRPATLQNLRKNKTLTFKKIGGTLYYKYEDVKGLLE